MGGGGRARSILSVVYGNFKGDKLFLDCGATFQHIFTFFLAKLQNCHGNFWREKSLA